MASIDEFLKKDIAFKSDFVKSPTGDLDTIQGLDNLKEALMRCLLTTPGSIIHRPEYGVNIKAYQGALNSIENQRRLAITIKEQFEKDSRVEQVIGVSVDYKDKTPEMVTINVRVRVVGYGETGFGFIPFGDA